MTPLTSKNITVLIALMLFFANLSGSWFKRNYVAEEFNVNIRIQDNNIILVSEEIILDMKASPGIGFRVNKFTRALNYNDKRVRYNNLKNLSVDKFEFLSATINGEIIKVEDLSEVQKNNIKNSFSHFTWDFKKPGQDKYHLTLNYYIKGMIFKQDNLDIFMKSIFPDNRNYLIKNSVITISYPKFSPYFVGFKVNDIENSDINQTHLKINKYDFELVIKVENLLKNNDINAGVFFQENQLIRQQPDWIVSAQHRNKTYKTYFIISFLIVCIGLGYSIFSYFKINQSYRLSISEQNTGVDFFDKENDMYEDNLKTIETTEPEELAVLLTNPNDFSNIPVFTLILNLLNLGYLKIISDKDGILYLHKNDIDELTAKDNLTERQIFILESLFDKDKALMIDEKTMSNTVSIEMSLKTFISGGKKINSMIEKDLSLKNLLDPERLKFKNRYILYSYIILIIAAFSIVPFGLLTVLPGGMIQLLLSLSLLIAGLCMFIIISNIKTLSIEGITLAKKWHPFISFLSKNLKNKNDDFSTNENHLPYYMSFKLFPIYIKKINNNTDTPIPVWFDVLHKDKEKLYISFVNNLQKALTSIK